MRQAYVCGLIHGRQGWFDLLTSYDLTSYIYDDDTVAKVFSMVRDCYSPYSMR